MVTMWKSRQDVKSYWCISGTGSVASGINCPMTEVKCDKSQSNHGVCNIELLSRKSCTM